MADAIPIDLIFVGPRLRQVTEDQVAAIADSIAEVGLLHPISVYERPVIQAGVSVPGYGLIAGLHRLEVAKRLGWETIPAHVVELSDLHRQIAECDENLCGTKLTPAERAIFTRRRKEAYEALHPETRNGVTGGGHNQLRQVGEAAPRFTADTAKRTGHSERSVQRDAARGERIHPEVIAQIQGTDLDNGVVLDRIAREPSKEAQLRAMREQQARQANRETDKIVAERRLDAAKEFLAARLDVTEMHTLGEMLAGICDTLSRALMREAA